MRIEWVKAHAFGPFQNESLQLGPGMNVIVGPNEAGKSSWHAALYAGLCGMRRSHGRGKKADADFAEQHQPWDTEGWRVTVLLRLEDGRRVEIDHDLETKTGRAIDADIGHDYTNQVIYEGGVDASCWLGLNRKVFLATACIKQADLIAILDYPDLLQEHLQRAADTAGAGATAAKALDTLAAFRQQRVGSTVAHARGPLRLAMSRVEQAERHLNAAHGRHDGYLALAVQVEEAEAQATRAERQVHLVEAGLARREAEGWEHRMKRARELLARYPEGPPQSALGDDEIARQVAEAVSAWETRPSIPALSGPSAEQLRQELAGLPDAPQGDVEVHQAIKAAAERYRGLADAFGRHAEEELPTPEQVETGGASEHELRDLARELDVPEPAVDPQLQGRVEKASQEIEQLPARSGSTAMLALGIGVGLVGVVALFNNMPPLGIGLLLSGAILVFKGWPKANEAARLQKILNLREAEAALGAQHHALEDVKRRQEAARSRVRALALDPLPESLRRLADQLAAAVHTRERREEWEERRRRLEEQLKASETQLVRAVEQRGVNDTADVVVALAAYEEACRQRREQATAAGRRAGLEQQAHVRERLEQARQEAEQKVAQAAVGLRTAGIACGFEHTGEEDVLLAGLKAWQAGRAERGKALDVARAEWSELQALLDGRSPAELASETARHTTLAATRAAGLPAEDLEKVTLADDVEQQLDDLRTARSAAARECDQLRGRLKQQEDGAKGVPEAEEELAAAQADLEQVRELATLIELAQKFLHKAQEEVHRNIAPILAGTVQRHLPKVTGDRYHEVLITPKTLDVRVRPQNGTWRRATLLSHGTAEQIYLLLRVALAEHLTKGGEVCPLILDEITAQSDPRRTLAILQTLHGLSPERQIVLFSQKPEVQEWAVANLVDGPDRFIQLSEPVVPA